MQIGNDEIKDIYYGSEQIKEVYYGSEKVWGEIEYIQDGYWVHKDTGVITYFGLDDPLIEGGVMGRSSWGPDCSEVNIPEGVTGLGNNCFQGCSFLTSITLPESLTSLNALCFRDCSSLPSINIPESVTSLGNSCLQGCSLLTSINIPEGVTSLGNSCFRFCSSLTLATVLPSTPPTLGTRVFDGVHTLFNIKVRSPYVNTYKKATNWIEYTNKISAI